MSKTRRNNRQHTRRRQRGAGFFNSITRLFQRNPATVQPTPAQQQQQEPFIEPTEEQRVEPKPGFFSRLFSRKRSYHPPTIVKPTPSLLNRLTGRTVTQKATVPFTPNYRNYQKKLNRNVRNLKPYMVQEMGTHESIKDAYNRDFVFLYKMSKKEDPYQNPKPRLTPQEKSELQKMVLRKMYNRNTNMFTVPEDMEEFTQSLTGLDEHTFDAKLKQYENQPPQGSMTSTLIPTPGAGQLARMIQPVLYSEDEILRTADTQDKICAADSPYINSVKNMQNGVCILLGYSIPALFKFIQSDMLYASVLYMVIDPRFHPESSKQKYKGSKVYDTSATISGAGVRSLELGSLGQSVILAHAMEHKALELIHPRLGFLFQTQLAPLWNKGYYNPDLNDLDRIVLLTLQKYAAIRRYMWTKDPALASQVYEVDPKTIANELRAPYFTLPGQPPFNSNAFFDEFRKNQLWINGIVKYKSYSDPGLDAFLPTNPDLNIVQMAKHVSNTAVRSYPLGTNPVFPWFSSETQKDVEQTPINSIPEEEEVRNEQFGTAIPFTESAAAAETARNILGTVQPTGFVGSVLPNTTQGNTGRKNIPRSRYIQSLIDKLSAKRNALNATSNRNLTVKNRVFSSRIGNVIRGLESTLAATQKMERTLTPQERRQGMHILTNQERNNYQKRYGPYLV